MLYKSFYINNNLLTVRFNLDIDIYLKAPIAIGLIFQNMQEDEMPCDYWSSAYFFVESGGEKKISYVPQEKIIEVNTYNSEWIGFILNTVENLICRHLRHDSICFHGSGLSFEKGCVAFLGQRNTGKTTIVKKLMKNYGMISYLDDDLIAVIDKTIWGAGLPIKSRTNEVGICIKCNSEKRYIFNYPQVYKTPQKLVALVYPSYNKVGSNSFIELSAEEGFERLFNNFKYGDNNLAIKTIIMLCKKIPSYCLEYSDDEFLFQSIAEIVQ